MHEAYREDGHGDLIDVVPFCSDACHRDHEGEAYQGWNGCHEAETPTYCAECGVEVHELVVNLIH